MSLSVLVGGGKPFAIVTGIPARLKGRGCGQRQFCAHRRLRERGLEIASRVIEGRFLMAATPVAFAAIFLVAATTVGALICFAHGVTVIIGELRVSQKRDGLGKPVGRRLWHAVWDIVSHRDFRGRPVVRGAHWLVMFSFVLLFLTLIRSYGQLLYPGWELPLLGGTIAWAWISEVFAWAGLVAIITLTAIRVFSGEARQSRFFGSRAWEGYFVEAVIFVVCLCVLGLHAADAARASTLNIAALEAAAKSGFFDPSGGLAANGPAIPTATWAHYPTTWWMRGWFDGLSWRGLGTVIVILAAVKILVSMSWLTVVGLRPNMGVAWHRFLAPVNLYTRRNDDGSKALGALAPVIIAGKPANNLEDVELEDPQTGKEISLGIGCAEDLTWKDRLDLYSCTECGRCQAVCPAWNTQKPLSPKILTLALRDAAAGEGEEDLDPFAWDVMWDCTMCGACVEQCPVDIEHVDRIAGLRRFQVLMESTFPKELGKPFKSLQSKANPYGQAPRKRLEWAKNLEFDVPVVGEDIEDASTVDCLFWVGCAGAYDDKQKQVTAAVAELLHAADVSFAVLGSGESCTGDPARRSGNEMLFQMLATSAIDTLNEAAPQKIVVTCAHCFNTIANEFPQLGGHFEVVHHSQLLGQLLRQKKLVPAATGSEGGADSNRKKITYHDPCFLGRHNRVFAPPREVLKQLGGVELLEMARNHENALCCGAGGARAWMEETRGTRISTMRMEEAKATGAQTVATACPFCTQMLGSANSEGIEVKDLAIVLKESLGL